MVKVVRVHEAGGPEVLTIEQIEDLAPCGDEVLLRHTAIGVNLIDTYHRTATSGQYAIPHPAIIGVEAAGVVERLGNTVAEVKVGDRVAYLMSLGAYAEKRLIKASLLIKLPDYVSDDEAAGGLLKGITAQYLLTRIYPVRSGTTVLNHSAAGGVGQLLNQMAKHKGARIIGTVGSEEKVAIARASGCDEVIVLGQQDIVTEARRFTGGLGVDVAYDSVGKDTFQKSLDCIRPLGMIVNFGQSSGPVPPLDISILAQKGSIFLAKPTLATFMASPAMRQELADEFFTLIKDGVVKINISRRAKLDEVASVHRDLEARKSAGAIVLKP